MTRFADAVAWAGSESVLNIFLLGGPVMVSVPADLTQPASVEMYPLERDSDDEDLWPPCREVDLTYPTLPHDVEQILTRVTGAAVAGGAVVAWAAFEGSFSFDHLLTADIANQVYAVADTRGAAVAVDDQARASAAWADRVAQARAAAWGRRG